MDVLRLVSSLIIYARHRCLKTLGRICALSIPALTLVSCGSDALIKDASQSSTSASVAGGSPSDYLPIHNLNGWDSVVYFFVHEELEDAIVESCQDVAESWNDILGSELLVYSGRVAKDRGETLFASLDDNQTVVYGETNWSATTEKSRATLATTIWENDITTDKIARGDVILNQEAFFFTDSLNEDYSNDVVGDPVLSPKSLADARTVLVHEFGHLIGLDHSDPSYDALSVMLSRTVVGQNRAHRVPSEQDGNHAKLIYGDR